MKWRGRLGWVLLGPTEHRVAAYLHDTTRFGRVTFRSVTLAAGLGLTRSELYRITRRLQSLGLFGIEDDRGGTHGGRRIWRTVVPASSTAQRLDPAKHRLAWSRIAAWARARAARILAALKSNPDRPSATPPRSRDEGRPPSGPAPVSPAGAGPPLTFKDAMRRFAPALATDWRL